MRLLSRVEVSELRLQKTADPPRPFQLRPVPQHSAPGLRSAGLLLPPYLSTSPDLPAWPAFACPAVGFPRRSTRLAERSFHSPGFREALILRIRLISADEESARVMRSNASNARSGLFAVMVASYLGITKEFLSKIRNQLMSES